MAIFLQTRGRTTDYAFLGPAPQERWWTRFEQRTTLEQPTIIIESPDGRLRAYFSGIQSPSRRDRVGTVIRYTVVVEDDPNAILALARACLMPEALDSATDLGRALDNLFVSEDEVDDLLRRGIAEGEGVSNRVAEAVRPYHDHSAGEDDPHQVSVSHWFGCVTSDAVRRAFIDSVKRLTRDDVRGLAARLNLTTQEEARRMRSSYQSLALLMEADERINRLGVVEMTLPTSRSSPSDPITAPTWTERHNLSISVRSWTVVLIGLLALFAWFSTGRLSTTTAATPTTVGAPVR